MGQEDAAKDCVNEQVAASRLFPFENLARRAAGVLWW